MAKVHPLRRDTGEPRAVSGILRRVFGARGGRRGVFAVPRHQPAKGFLDSKRYVLNRMPKCGFCTGYHLGKTPRRLDAGDKECPRRWWRRKVELLCLVSRGLCVVAVYLVEARRNILNAIAFLRPGQGKMCGVLEDLVSLLGKCSPRLVTYAGGASSLKDLDRVSTLFGRKVNGHAPLCFLRVPGKVSACTCFF